MKLSIKLLSTLVLFLTIGSSVFAQKGERPQHDPVEMAERETSRLTEELELGESQVIKMKEINLAYAKKMQEARENNSENREAMKEVRDAINSDKSAEIKTILSEDQYKKYESLMAERGNRKGRSGKRGRGERG